MVVLVTGAAGFLGKNLCVVLRQCKGVDVREQDLDTPAEVFDQAIREADIVFHLAGVNRPVRTEQFAEGNAALTENVLQALMRAGRAPKVVLSSSIQAERDNPYGTSKRGAEEALCRYCGATSAEGVAHRLKNLFGKWSRPNYNSVVATFANSIANDLPYQVSDPAAVVDLTYVDDVVAAFLAELDAPAQPGFRFAPPLVSRPVALGELVALLQAFKDQRKSLLLPDLAQPFVRALYATYLSYLPPEAAGYQLDIRSDPRGSLAELIKSPHFGQIFVSRTKPGITRGNHFHHTKTEKFMVVQGEGLIRLRQIHGDRVVEFRCRGEEYRVVDMLPGYTHSIENVGEGELVTLFWSSEVFDPSRPDTFFDPVLPPAQA